MVDLSKHLQRAKQALERRNYDLAIETCHECVDISPNDLEFHVVHLEASRRKAKESGKRSLLPSLGFGGLSKDPHKQFISSFKKLSANPDGKVVIEVGDASLKLANSGTKAMTDIAIFYYEDFKKGGLFNGGVLWNLAQLYFEKYKEVGKTDKDGSKAWLEKAIKTMDELNRAMPNHPEAAKQVKNWEAMRSMDQRNTAGSSNDYRSQLASDDKARRAEVMNRLIRTLDDAKEVLKYVDEDLKQNPNDKSLWVKKGDVHRRLNQLGETKSQMAEAKAAFEKGQALDPHDYTITMKLGDLRLEEMRERIKAAEAGGQDAGELKKELLVTEIAEYRTRVERQPTDMNHRYNLGTRLLKTGAIDQAASEFQRTVNDPRLRRGSHRYLGYCFTKKNLLDLASGQYAAYLQLIEDELAEEAKEVRYSLARVYEDLQKKTEAIATYEKLVALDLGYRDAADRLSKLRGA
jgi:tetratricopeptide (TPR) repeat protein